MHPGKLRDMSGKTGKYRKLKKVPDDPPENAGRTPSAVVIMTTADGVHPTFPGRHTQPPITSDLHRVLTEIAEVNTDNARSALKCTTPLPPKTRERLSNR